MSNFQGSRARTWITVIAVVAGLVAGGCGSSSAGASVRLEPAASPGSDPFTASVAIGPAVEFPGNVRAIVVSNRKKLHADAKTHTLVAVGTAPGLYGGTNDSHVCDPDRLVAFLAANPDKAAAWASVLGITAKAVGAYVSTLTPVVLTNDTLVTNHGYRDGEATTLQSVLQAGTAVMVDQTGTPRVKCNCGNPLTAPALIDLARADTQGQAWGGYDATAVTTVKSGREAPTLSLVDIHTGDAIAGSTGTAPGADNGTGIWVAAEFLPRQGGRHAIVTSSDGHTWTEVSQLDAPVVGLAWGDGKWILAAGRDDGGDVFESADLRTWTRVATVADSLTGIAYGHGRWIATARRSLAPLSSGVVPASPVVYTSTDARHWTRTASTGATGVIAGQAVAYGGATWLTAVGQDPSSFEIFTSSDGLRWTANGAHVDGSFPWLAFGSGQWILGSIPVTGAAAGYFTSPNTTQWTPASPTGLGPTSINAMAFGNGTFLAAGPLPFSSDPTLNIAPGSAIFTSANAKNWTRVGKLDFGFDALAFGPAPTGVASTTTTTIATSSCGGLDSYIARLNEAGRVTASRRATTDPNWARVAFLPRRDSTIVVAQVVFCQRDTWMAHYIDQPGCTDNPAPHTPAAVREELGLNC